MPQVINKPDPPSSRKLESRSVSFNEVEIREYERCIGNNPATTYGPSLAIGWEYQEAVKLKLEDYEQSRPQRRRPNQMQVPGSIRESILKEHTDCTKQDISRAVQEVLAARHQRNMTLAMIEFEVWQMLFERTKRKVKRWRNRTSAKKEQEWLWENAQLRASERVK
jgi:hypothetical protein